MLALAVVVLAVVGALLASELRKGRAQAHVLAWVAKDVGHWVEAGPSATVQFPEYGPYDVRLGYTRLPEFVERLQARGGEVLAQARWSDRMAQLADMGVFPLYAEKANAGLRLLDRNGRPLFDATTSRRTWEAFEDIPPVLARTLLLIENRELLDDSQPHRNPAIEWRRMAFAVSQAALKLLDPNRKVPGASTLATQMEKFRHSPAGLTPSASEKLRQMSAAALRAYLDGPDTSRARRRILQDYVNSVPLGAVPGYGEVHGFGEGLWAWFGTDFESANALLHDAERAGPDDPRLAERARAYRQALALVIGLRRPSHFFIDDHAALAAQIDRALEELVDKGVISEALYVAARHAPLAFARGAAPLPAETLDRKGADAIRTELLGQLGVPQLYDLDRLDLTVHTTLDGEVQRAMTEALHRLATDEGAEAAGILGHRLLSRNDLSQVRYAFTLYERVGGQNVVRVHTDTHPGQFSLNDGMKLELGSTAKLRTLVSYLEVVADLHAAHAGQPRAALRKIPVDPRDHLSRFVIDWLIRNPKGDLRGLLAAAMDRKYPASPHERFFTGGGEHRFGNFDDKDDKRILTVRDSFTRSVNLPFVRMMRDVIYHFTWRDGTAAQVLDDPAHPAREAYLSRFADHEGRVYLETFYRRYAGLPPHEALAKLADKVEPRADRLATVFRTVRPAAGPRALEQFLAARLRDAPVQADVVDLHRRYGPAAFSLHDRGYIARTHPLELWTVAWLAGRPQGTLAQLLADGAEVRQEVYDWLRKSTRTRAQNTRIRVVMEQDAFAELHRRWQRLGFPFDALVPSYATALGSSGDRPSALAELAGIISAGGVRHPMQRLTRLHFGAETPYETVVAMRGRGGERVLRREVADVVRDAMYSVVEKGTAERVRSAFGGGPLRVGGKTGTGDNRSIRKDARGRVISETVRNRTGTLVFVAGSRWFGVVTAYVPGEAAGEYAFTSALPSQILKSVAPRLLPAFAPPRWRPEQSEPLRSKPNIRAAPPAEPAEDEKGGVT